jgi:hypothetical protein
LEKNRKGIRNELVQSYRDYLNKTRESSALTTASNPEKYPIGDSASIIRNNFNRLKGEFHNAIEALEQQYLTQYQQLVELKGVVDIEKNSILSRELEKLKKEFEIENEASRNEWQREEDAYEIRKKERDRVEKIYLLNLDMWKRDIEGYERKKTELERDIDEKKNELQYNLEEKKRIFEQELIQKQQELAKQEEGFNNEIRIKDDSFNKRLIEKEKIFQAEISQKEASIHEIEQEIAHNKQGLEKAIRKNQEQELLIERKEVALKNIKAQLISRQKKLDQEEEEFKRVYAQKQQQEESKIALLKAKVAREVDDLKKRTRTELELKRDRFLDRKRILSAELELKRQQLASREAKIEDIEKNQEDIRTRLKILPKEIESVRKETESVITKRLNSKYAQEIESFKRERDSELNLARQMNSVLESKIDERDKKIKDLSDRLLKMGQLNPLKIKDSGYEVESSYNRTQPVKQTGNYPKIVRSIRK